jgi:hypothetical protein
MVTSRLFISLFLFSVGIANANSLTVAEFNQLPAREQNQLLKAAKDTATTMVAWVSNDSRISDKPTIAKDFKQCLLDRDVAWLRKSLRDFEVEFEASSTSFGGAVVATIAWKCNYLSKSENPTTNK